MSDANALVWLENLWLQEGRYDQWPDSKLVAQTTLGPAEAACAFADSILPEAAARLVQDQVMKRKEEHRGAFLTFREEFLNVASMLKNPLLLLIVGQGGLVKSVQLCTPGEKPRVVNTDDARAAFDRTLAVAIDYEAARTVTVYFWPKYGHTCDLMDSIAALDFPPEKDTPATGPLSDAVVSVWEGNEETRKRIERAHARLLTRGLW